jgi:endonuclease/exonuclease/phosphatase family metal-dependent hydrolase
MESKPLPIRILTHNIRYATSSLTKGEHPWSIRAPFLTSGLYFHSLHPSTTFLCLQEVLHSQLLDILSVLPEWTYIGVGRDDGLEAGEYSPIIYRPSVWDLEASKTVWLSTTPDRPSKSWDAICIRILTIGVFIHRESRKKVVVMNTHLDHWGSESRYQGAHIILREIQKIYDQEGGREPLPVFLGGDFNSKPEQEAYQVLNGEGSGVRDLREMVGREMRYGNDNTYTGFGFEAEAEKRIDFLFVGPRDGVVGDQGDGDGERRTRKILRVQSYGVLQNRFEDGVYCSDHRAVVADVVLE